MLEHPKILVGETRLLWLQFPRDIFEYAYIYSYMEDQSKIHQRYTFIIIWYDEFQ